MPSGPRRLLRAAAAALAGLVYSLPLLVGAASEIAHGAFHLSQIVREHQSAAAALGLVHQYGHERSAPGVGFAVAEPARAEPTRSGSTRPTAADHSSHVHAHGGTVHTHDAPTDALMAAAERAEERSEADRISTVKLANHLPASGAPIGAAMPFERAAPAGARSAPPTRSTRPLLPPPRA